VAPAFSLLYSCVPKLIVVLSSLLSPFSVKFPPSPFLNILLDIDANPLGRHIARGLRRRSPSFLFESPPLAPPPFSFLPSPFFQELSAFPLSSNTYPDRSPSFEEMRLVDFSSPPPTYVATWEWFPSVLLRWVMEASARLSPGVRRASVDFRFITSSPFAFPLAAYF